MSLPQFPVLKRLKLPINAILPFDNSLSLSFLGTLPICQSTLGSYLPLSIEDFSFSTRIHGPGSLFNQLYDFAEKDLRSFTKLKRLHVLDIAPQDPGWFVLKEKSLKRMLFLLLGTEYSFANAAPHEFTM